MARHIHKRSLAHLGAGTQSRLLEVAKEIAANVWRADDPTTSEPMKPICAAILSAERPVPRDRAASDFQRSQAYYYESESLAQDILRGCAVAEVHERARKLSKDDWVFSVVLSIDDTVNAVFEAFRSGMGNAVDIYQEVADDVSRVALVSVYYDPGCGWFDVDRRGNVIFARRPATG
jgi:hypothetical protein